MIQLKPYIIILSMALILCRIPAWAAEETPSETLNQKTAVQALPEKLPGPVSEEPDAGSDSSFDGPVRFYYPSAYLDRVHGGLSTGLLATATWLDSFFGDERYIYEDNRSYVRLLYDVFQEEGAKLLLKPAADVRLVLPQLEKKAHIVLSAEPTDLPEDAKTPVLVPGEQAAASEERNFTAALEYFFRNVPRESFIIRTGAQASDGQPVLFIVPRYRSLVPLDSWDFRFTQEVMYRTDTAWQTNTRFDLERKLFQDMFFRASIDGSWYDNRNGYFPNLVLSVRQAIDASHAVDYEWVNNYQTRPAYELTEVALRVRYRHSFWRKWLFGEVSPQIRFPRESNFEGTPGILFRLEMFFGK